MIAYAVVPRSFLLILLITLPSTLCAQGGAPILRAIDHPDSMRWILVPQRLGGGDYLQEPKGVVPPPPVTPRVVDRTGLFEVGRMANTLSMLYDNRCSIAHDPKSKQVMTVVRGLNRSIFGDGRSLYVRYAQRHGAQWSLPGEDMAEGGIAGYPSVFLPYADNASWPHAVMIWSRETEFPAGPVSYGDIGTMYGGIGHPTMELGTVPDPPNWGVPWELRMDQSNGDLYTVSLGIEPTNAAAFTGEYYLLRSSDGGRRWSAVTFDSPVYTEDMLPPQYVGRNLRFDISPDGRTMVAAWVSVYKPSEHKVQVLDHRNEIMWRISTDGGLNWGWVERRCLNDLAMRPSPFEQRIGMTWDFDVVIDARNRLHFLTVCSSDLDPFDPFAEAVSDSVINPAHVDSTFVTEVIVDSTGTHLLPVGPVRRIRTERRSFTEISPDDRPCTLRNEVKWARNYDGTALYAKWISPRQTWIPAEENGQVVLYPDTLSQVYVNGRVADDTGPFAWYHRWAFDVPGENPPWRDSLMRVTDLPDIGAKCTQVARYAGDGGQLHMAFVEWGEGDTPDSDPMHSEQIVWYIKDVKVPVLDTEEAPSPSAVPSGVVIQSVAPNPVSASATITYRLDRYAPVVIRVIDALGRVVSEPERGSRDAGVYAVAFDAGNLPPGVYLVRLEAGARAHTRRMVVVP